MRRPLEDANHGWGLLKHGGQLLALTIGLAVGAVDYLRVGLTGAQGFFDCTAGLGSQGSGVNQRPGADPLAVRPGKCRNKMLTICLLGYPETAVGAWWSGPRAAQDCAEQPG